MSVVVSVAEAELSEKVAQQYERIREVLQVDEVPAVFRHFAVVPSLLSDLSMNFRKFVLGNGKLELRRRLLIATAVAGHFASQSWLEFLESLADRHGIKREELLEAKAVASANSMYNSLFKFRDLSGTDIFNGMAIGLRAHTFAGTSLDEGTVELINIAVSNINGCKPCTSGHVQKAQALNVSDEAIYEAIQCASTIVCGAQFLRSIGVA